MTAKEFVLERYPKARAERHRTNSVYNETYWLIRNSREYFYMSEGKTESNAWVNAKKKILKNENN